MLPDRVSNPGPLTYESGALPIALRGPARNYEKQHTEGTCKVSGRSVVFSAFYADFCLCPKLEIITTLT